MQDENCCGDRVVECSPPPVRECSVCRDNTGRDIEHVKPDTILAYLQPFAAYKDKNGNLLAVPSSALFMALMDSANEIASQSRLLRRTWYGRTQKDVRDYYIQPHEGEQVWLIDSVRVGDYMLSPTNPIRGRECAHCYPACSTEWNRTGLGFKFEIPDKIVLDESPCRDSECVDIEVQFVATLKADACSLDAQLWERHREDLRNGVFAKVRMQPGFDWHFPAQGAFHEKEWRKGVASAKIDVANRFNTGRSMLVDEMSF